MQALGEWLERQPPSPQAAFEAHYRLVSVHPFSDGNGRTARLLMNLLLLRGGYPPVVIGPEHRKPYIDGLETAQLGGGKEAYEAFMAGRLDASLTDYLEHLGKELEARQSGPSLPQP
jgi:Fic family protein